VHSKEMTSEGGSLSKVQGETVHCTVPFSNSTKVKSRPAVSIRIRSLKFVASWLLFVKMLEQLNIRIGYGNMFFCLNHLQPHLRLSPRLIVPGSNPDTTTLYLGSGFTQKRSGSGKTLICCTVMHKCLMLQKGSEK
jgi:hypothetical protein